MPAAGLALSIVLALVVGRSVTRPVQAIRAVLDKIADGDLRVRVEDVGRDELGSAAAARAMRDRAQAMGEGADVSVDRIEGMRADAGAVASSVATVAARAGEAGKGFAVVASEVEELAQETARATEDIAGRVNAIQADTTHAISAIRELSSVISDYQTIIAAAVEEQTATTNEMNRNVAEASQGSQRIAESVDGVDTGADLEQAIASYVV